MKVFVLCTFVFVVVLQLPSEGEAVCCRAAVKKFGVSGSLSGVGANGEPICHDCTYPTPCCGHGKCNIFCCNCDRGCRGGCRAGRSIGGWARALTEDGDPGTGHDVVQEGDLDGDGRLSLTEAHHYVSKRSTHDAETAERMLMEMDLDNDNFFSPDEIDY